MGQVRRVAASIAGGASGAKNVRLGHIVGQPGREFLKFSPRVAEILSKFVP